MCADLSMTLVTCAFILSGCLPIRCARHSTLRPVLSSPRWLITARSSHVKALVSVSRVISATVRSPAPSEQLLGGCAAAGSSSGQTRAPWLMSTRVSSMLSSRCATLRDSRLLPCKFTATHSQSRVSSFKFNHVNFESFT